MNIEMEIMDYEAIAAHKSEKEGEKSAHHRLCLWALFYVGGGCACGKSFSGTAHLAERVCFEFYQFFRCDSGLSRNVQIH